MPIFRKGDQYVLFSHVPKTAGVSLYKWFVLNGWDFGNVDAGSEYTSSLCASCNYFGNFGIRDPKVSYQHQKIFYSMKWGFFDTTFVIVRDPLSRLYSEIKHALYYFSKLPIEASMSEKNYFVSSYLNTVDYEIKSGNLSVRDNHFVRQSDFLDVSCEVYTFDRYLMEKLAERFGLSGPCPHLNEARVKFEPDSHTEKLIHEFVQTHFQTDQASFADTSNRAFL